MIKTIAVLAALMTAVFTTSAQARSLNLPTNNVVVTVTGEVPDSFFNATLSQVPPGYDVANNSYLMWCIELFAPNPPLIDGGVHEAILLSSTSSNLPPTLASIPWPKINYLLNNKIGTASDVQAAIWHFTDGFNPDPMVNPAALTMIAAANANGATFVPGSGDVVAAIVVWQNFERVMQLCIIEVPPTAIDCSDRFTAGGFVFRNGAKVTFGIQGGIQNGRLWGGINFVDHGTKLHVRSRTITSYTVLDANCRRATYDVTINGVAGTATVRVCDNGEPGRNDVMEITLSNGYSAGVGTTLGGTGRGGGNVQLHKPRCHDPKPTRAARSVR